MGDQIADCRRYMQKHHLDSDPLIFTDCTITGQHANRSGYHDMVDALRTGRLYLILAEGLDRLSRNLTETSGLYKLSRYYDTDMITVIDGKITQLHIGFKGTNE
ncbi:MAG: recombinase family protein [Alphaproteobacteria bacterium]|nr:recombinase family protein [Alphaproteobacteria bacterium]